jgi:antitoxin YefM
MTTSIKIKANELDDRLINKLKSLFKDKEIEIRVIEESDTEYLQSTSANRERLLKAINDIESGKELIKVDIDKF